MRHDDVTTILKNAISAVAMARHRIIFQFVTIFSKKYLFCEYNKRNGGHQFFIQLLYKPSPPVVIDKKKKVSIA